MNKDQMIAQMRDPKFYLEHFTKIKTKDRGLQPFILNEAQKDLYNTLNKNNRVIILKVRQLGFSTAVCGYFYHKTITTPGFNTALIGYNTELTMEFLDKIKTFYRATPEEFRPTIHYNSKYEISFPKIDSKIIILPSTENVGRGYTLNLVLASEVAFWEKAEEKMATLEASAEKGMIVVESTPSDVGTWYHKTWVTDENEYIKKEYGWWWGYSQEEIDRIERRMNDPQRFAREYGLTFLTAGRPVFDAAMVKEMRKGILKIGDEYPKESGKFVTETPDHLIVYQPPEEGVTYVVGGDVAEGVTGGDYSVAVIFNRLTGEEVAMFRGHVAPEQFGKLLNGWGRYYNNALMAVEVNNHGLTTLIALKNLSYPSIYYRPNKFETIATSYTDKLGWKTNKLTRPLLIDDFGQGLRDKILTIHSKYTLDEMMTFVYNDAGDMVSLNSYHDDTIFASGIAYQGFKMLYTGKLDQLPDSALRHLGMNSY